MLDLLEGGILFSAENVMKDRDKKVATKMTRAVFSPPKVLRKTDKSEEGSYNISGAACFRSIQQLKKYERGFLFSKSSIVRAANQLEVHAKTIIDWDLIKEEGEAERVEYKNFSKVLVETIKAYGLKQKALTVGVEIAFSSDGADFTRMRGHTSTGYRLLDIDAKYPRTDLCVFDDGKDEQGRQKLKSYQSRDICHILSMAQVKETKQHYQEKVKHIFTFMNLCASDGIEIGNETYKIKCCFPADLSCHWKVLGMGGACKVAKNFCHLCGCTSPSCAKYKVGSRRCETCISANVAECYHHMIDNDKEIERKKRRMSELELKYTYLKGLEVSATNDLCAFLSDPNDGNKKNMPNHIDYKGQTRAQQLTFSSDVTKQLRLRGLALQGQFKERLERLRDALYSQEEYLTIHSTVQRYEESRPNRLIPVDWCIPCIMHLHNRVVEKVIAMLIKKGYSKRGSAQEKDEYIKALENTMNSCVLGSEYNETNWQVPLNDTKTDVLATISFTDMQSKKVMAFINLLLADVFDDSIPDWEIQLEQWTHVINTFSQLDKMLQLRVDFTDEMIEDFQKLADSFFRTWVSLNGMAGVTNYIHMLGSGHIKEFLYKYRNLYKYSQQGWEHQNKRANGTYHKHSQKGGHGSSLNNRSQILPIFRYCTRAWMWATKKADDFFNIMDD